MTSSCPREAPDRGIRERIMFMKLLRHFPRLMRLYEIWLPHKFVDRWEGERFGLFNEQTWELLGSFPIGSADTVVDVGCGMGTASVFAADCGAAVYAVDVDPSALATVQK